MAAYPRFGRLLVPGTTVRQKMFELGISAPDAAERRRLAEALGADAFLVPAVPHAALLPMPHIRIGSGFAPQAKVHVRLIVVSPDETEVAVFQASDQREGGTIHTLEGIIGKLFKGIMEKLPAAK